jgi:hypothetical protein
VARARLQRGVEVKVTEVKIKREVEVEAGI